MAASAGSAPARQPICACNAPICAAGLGTYSSVDKRCNQEADQHDGHIGMVDSGAAPTNKRTKKKSGRQSTCTQFETSGMSATEEFLKPEKLSR